MERSGWSGRLVMAGTDLASRDSDWTGEENRGSPLGLTSPTTAPFSEVEA
jgi:hypothetical protein